MAITSVGYDGIVTESDWADMIKKIGSSDYGVVDSGHLRVTAVASVDRTVAIAAGSAWGHGVFDTLDSSATLQLNSISSGSRWDLVALRRDWTGASGVTTVVSVPGNATKQIPSGRFRGPGLTDDQPLALVQVTAGVSQPTAIVDLRVWAGNGGMVGRDEMVLAYLKHPGAQINVNTAVWSCTLDGNSNPVWGRIDLAGNVRWAPLQDSQWAVQGDIVIELVQGRRRVTVDLMVTRTGGKFDLESGFWQTVCTCLPWGVRATTAKDVKYLPVSIVGGGNNIHASAYLHPSTGVLGIKAAGPKFLFTTGALFTLNCVYFIN